MWFVDLGTSPTSSSLQGLKMLPDRENTKEQFKNLTGFCSYERGWQMGDRLIMVMNMILILVLDHFLYNSNLNENHLSKLCLYILTKEQIRSILRQVMVFVDCGIASGFHFIS